MSKLFNDVFLAPEEEPDAEDIEFAERAEDDKQAAFDAGRGV